MNSRVNEQIPKKQLHANAVIKNPSFEYKKKKKKKKKEEKWLVKIVIVFNITNAIYG